MYRSKNHFIAHFFCTLMICEYTHIIKKKKLRANLVVKMKCACNWKHTSFLIWPNNIYVNHHKSQTMQNKMSKLYDNQGKKID